MKNPKTRCPWSLADAQMTHYHDTEWGVPNHSDRKHFEFLILEAAQAGLSWQTVLKKRQGYQKNFANFDPKKVAKFDQNQVKKMLLDPSIVRNRLKIEAAINNAKKFLEVQKEFGSFDRYIWGFVNFKPIKNSWKSQSQIPATTPESDALSKDLKKRGFKFVGSTVIYAHMQAIGLINDHLTSCFCYKQVSKKK